MAASFEADSSCEASLGLNMRVGASFEADSQYAASLSVQTAPLFSNQSGTLIRVTFPQPVRTDGLADASAYSFATQTGYPISILDIEIEQTVKATGHAQTTEDPFLVGLLNPLPLDVVVGDYFVVTGGLNTGQYRIEGIEVLPPRVRLSLPLSVGTALLFEVRSAVKRVYLTTSKATNGAVYTGTVRATPRDNPFPLTLTGSWTGVAELPALGSVSYLDDGALVLDFGESMRFDEFLTSPAEYSVTPLLGEPSLPPVEVVEVKSVSSTSVALTLRGLQNVPYQVTVNAAGTPHDIAGNPISPSFNTAVFTSTVPVTTRSIFTDRGPIARPPLVLLEGVNAQVISFTDVQVPTGTVSNDAVGRYLKLIGTGKNDGDYFITSVPAPNRIRVKASFALPDTAATSWSVYDPRDGQIADDPAHVTVRINGVVTPAEAVIGLLGQIVMPVAPRPEDDVKVDYSWVCNPVVDVARLNSKEFRFNNWNRDIGRPADLSSHKYRFNNVLVQPENYTLSKTIQQGVGSTVASPSLISLTSANLNASFVGLTLHLTKQVGLTLVHSYYRIDAVPSSTSVQVSPATLAGTYLSWEVLDQTSVVPATLDQPRNRELHYRAYERAYTAIFNDPNLLVFNTPHHHIAYPPMQRTLASEFVSYLPTTLPDTYPGKPWERLPPAATGTGTASIVLNELVVTDTTSGPFPNGDPILWRRKIDLSFPHVFALAWRMYVDSVPAYQGVFTGVAAGYSLGTRAIVVGYIEVGGVKQFGFLRRGYGDNPGDPNAWIGGFDGSGNATLAPVNLDWTVIHSYRLYRGKDGNVRLYLDGDVVETLKVYEEDLPFLEELASPFNEAQQVFWGSISRPATNVSNWAFVRYQSLPLNPLQSSPSSFTSYEANVIPENDPSPWTPIGYHGTETILGTNYLYLSSTSATNIATEGKAGLIGGDFRGFMRLEPLLSASSDVVLDVNLRGLYQTHGVTPNALMAAIDDGNRLTQLSFLAKKPAPKLGYGGRSFPTQWAPTPWSAMGGASAEMLGRVLRIIDATTTDGLVYYLDDTAPPGSAARVVESTTDYAYEFRCQVRTYTPDPAGFAGVSADVYDSTRDVGILLREVGGVREVAFHSDGVVKAAYPFEWFDGQPHTYRLVKSGADVSLFIDWVFVGSLGYATFDVPAPSPTGTITFGSSTPASNAARSVVDWHYANSWRIWPDQRYYVGLWRGTSSVDLTSYPWTVKAAGAGVTVTGNLLTDPGADFSLSVEPGDTLLINSGANQGAYLIESVPSATTLLVSSTTPLPVQPDVVSYRVPVQSEWVLWSSSTANLTDFHLPLKTRGQNATVNGTVLYDPLVNFVALGVVAGDVLLIDSGENRGVYEVQAVPDPNRIAVSAGTPFPVQPSVVAYRIPREADWTTYHRYRIARTPAGSVAVIRDFEPTALIEVEYSNEDLPASPRGVPYIVSGGVPSILWGSFDPTNLVSSAWDYVRYGITRAPSELRIVPHHQVMNQRNVIASPEHLRSNIPHVHTDFWSSSTGIPPQTEPDLLRNSALLAYTQLNDGTPLVPSTQTSEVRVPTPVQEFISAFNKPEDVMNVDGDFRLNDGATRYRLLVPDDVLYNSLEVIEQVTGVEGLIRPFDDDCQPSAYAMEWQKEVCLSYDGSTLPENAPNQPTPWTLAADNPLLVSATAFAGVLTFGTNGTRALYRNATPLTDSPSLSTQITFRMKVLSDTTLGLGDSQIRLGFSAIGMTLALAFVTSTAGPRYVLVVDLNAGVVLGGIPFDYLDGNFHTYRIVRDPGHATVTVSVVS